MVARGEVGLIIATLGFEQGHITQGPYAVLVLTTVAVSVLGPLLMAPAANHLGRERSPGMQ
ncbi:MAG: hypothetical protein VX663_06095 [Pseudomonadota bacterium]|nr:hypothetical protein [Pseudomonadota bacterium]